MKKEFKLISLLLALILLFSCLTACDGTQNISSDNISSENETSSLPPPEPDPITVNIGNVGDFLIHTEIISSSKSGDEYDFSEVFKYVSDYYKAFDYFVGNLEVTLGGTSTAYIGNGSKFNCPDGLIDSLKNAGVDMLLTANNHSYDTYSYGFHRTGEVLAQKQMDFIGTHFGDQKKYKVVDVEGIKLGMINYTYQTGDLTKYSLNGITLKSGDEKFINTFSYDYLDVFYSEMKTRISEMYQDGAEAIVLYIHWGNEYHLEPNSVQKTIAQKMCDLGVDVIVGSHPHVVEPIDILSSSVSGKQTVCLYSAGNVVSSQVREFMPNTGKKFPHVAQGASEDGVIFSVSFTKKGNGEVVISAIDVLPTWVNRYWGNGKTRYEIVPLDKNVDYVNQFNVNATAVGASRVEVSYNRTMGIMQSGLNKFNNEYIQKDLRKTAN